MIFIVTQKMKFYKVVLMEGCIVFAKLDHLVPICPPGVLQACGGWVPDGGGCTRIFQQVTL